MKIGILGTGNMGRSLGLRWRAAGHDVFFGSRTPDKAKAVAGESGTGGTYDEAVAYGDVILNTVRGIVLSKLLTSVAPLDGKVVIDLNNRSIPANFEYDPIAGPSLAEEVAVDIPNAHVVKAFNTLAQEVFEHDQMTLRSESVNVFVSGDDDGARATVMSLASDLGFVPVDCGRLRNARLLESLADFVRLLMIGQKRGPYMTFSVKELPTITNPRLGGRQPSELDS